MARRKSGWESDRVRATIDLAKGADAKVEGNRWGWRRHTALVGEKLFVFSWEGGKEVLRCLEVETGKELWKDEYDAARASGPASGFAGARSSPTVVR